MKLTSNLEKSFLDSYASMALTICGFIFLFSISFLYYRYIQLEEYKYDLIVLWVIQKILTELFNKKFQELQDDPEIDIEEFSHQLVSDLKKDMKFIKEKILTKVKLYFEEDKECNIYQVNYYLNGKIHSFWKFKTI